MQLVEKLFKTCRCCYYGWCSKCYIITTSGYNQNAITAANMINRQDNFKIELWGKQKLIDFANKNI